jgi:hypothetical protein
MNFIVTSNDPLQVRGTCHGMANYAMHNLKNNNVDVDSNSTSFKMDKNPNQKNFGDGKPTLLLIANKCHKLAYQITSSSTTKIIIFLCLVHPCFAWFMHVLHALFFNLITLLVMKCA